MMATAGFLEELKCCLESFSRFHLANKQANVFYLRGSIKCCFSHGQVEFYWKQLPRLIQPGMFVSAMGDFFQGTVRVIAAFSDFCRLELRLLGIDG
jgi:hypothetical protein